MFACVHSVKSESREETVHYRAGATPPYYPPELRHNLAQDGGWELASTAWYDFKGAIYMVAMVGVAVRFHAES